MSRWDILGMSFEVLFREEIVASSLFAWGRRGPWARRSRPCDCRWGTEWRASDLRGAITTTRGSTYRSLFSRRKWREPKAKGRDEARKAELMGYEASSSSSTRMSMIYSLSCLDIYRNVYRLFMVTIILGVKRRKGGILREVICKCGVKCHGYAGNQPRENSKKE